MSQRRTPASTTRRQRRSGRAAPRARRATAALAPNAERHIKTPHSLIRRTGMCIGLDIGGTAIRAALVDERGRVHLWRSARTPSTVDAAEDAIVDMVTTLAEGRKVRAVGLAVAGLMTADRTKVMFAPHLAWRDSPVAERIAARVGLPVVMDHDVNCAAWAEYRLGVAAGARIALVVAVGTGIGAGLVIDGRIYRGSFGVAPELGHLVVVPEGRQCACGKRGCLERYCSGTALAQTAIEYLAMGETTMLTAIAASPDTEITGRDVARAARQGDTVALDAVSDLGRWLGLGLAMACDVLDPEIIVIGGGVSASADLFLDTARAHLASHITGGRYRPAATLVPAQFGSDASVVGAALLAAEGR